MKYILGTARGRAMLLAGLAILVAGAGQPARADGQSPVGADDDPTTPQLEHKIDVATEKSLTYLARCQRKDGGWGNGNFDCGVTSLAVLAFLAKGHQPGEAPYGPAIDKAVDFVISRQKPNGLIAGSDRMYGHGISTLMLAEIVGQTTDKRSQHVRDALGRAVKLILDAQQVAKPAIYRGGWRYQPTSEDSDISCTGWQLMALRAAKNAGATVPTTAIDQAVAYVKRCACPEGGFSYQAELPKSSLARAGTGIVALELCGKHYTKEALSAGDWILAHSVGPFETGSGEGQPYYRMYYCSQAMYQLGGRYWKLFWPTFADGVLTGQLADGSYPEGTAGGEAKAGPAYTTSMAVLALSVRYRLLPIYQR